MGQILRNWRIIGALAFAVVLVGGVYLLSRAVENPAVAEASAETALLQSLATKDSTGDGLPDWQKSLYGIPLDATTTDYFNLGMTDGEAVARGLIVPKAIADSSSSATSTDQGTLTDAFSKAFFTLYVAAKQKNGGANLSAQETQTLANEALTKFIENFVPAADAKRLGDLRIAGSGSGALADFAVAAEAVFNRYQSRTPINEFQAVRDVIQSNDPQAAARVAQVAQIYRQYAAGILALTVPSTLASPDLDLINALFQRAAVYDGIAKADNDPLLAVVSLQALMKSEAGWAKAFADMGNIFLVNNVRIADGEPGSSFIRLAEKLAAPLP